MSKISVLVKFLLVSWALIISSLGHANGEEVLYHLISDAASVTTPSLSHQTQVNIEDSGSQEEGGEIEEETMLDNTKPTTLSGRNVWTGERRITLSSMLSIYDLDERRAVGVRLGVRLEQKGVLGWYFGHQFSEGPGLGFSIGQGQGWSLLSLGNVSFGLLLPALDVYWMPFSEDFVLFFDISPIGVRGVWRSSWSVDVRALAPSLRAQVAWTSMVVSGYGFSIDFGYLFD